MDLKRVGYSLSLLGFAFLVYAMVFMEVSIGGDVVNLGLLNMRQNLVIVGSIAFVVGALCLIASHFSPQSSRPTAPRKPFQVPQRATVIKLALILFGVWLLYQYLFNPKAGWAPLALGTLLLIPPAVLYWRLRAFGVEKPKHSAIGPKPYDLRMARYGAGLFVGLCFTLIFGFYMNWFSLVWLLPALFISCSSFSALTAIRVLHISNAVLFVALTASGFWLSNGEIEGSVLIMFLTPAVISVICILRVQRKMRRSLAVISQQPT